MTMNENYKISVAVTVVRNKSSELMTMNENYKISVAVTVANHAEMSLYTGSFNIIK